MPARGGHADRIIRAYVDATCAGDEWLLAHVDRERVAERVHCYVDGLPSIYNRLFYIALYAFEYLMLPFATKLRPFTWLPLAEKVRILEEWTYSWNYFKRLAAKLLSAITISCLYSEPELLSAIGFDPALEARRNHPVREPRGRYDH